jgi:basic amino acid/polyamine antiporter, APA family
MKELTYIDVVLIGIGYILGAGIYTLLGLISKYSGNMIWLSILITGIISLITAYSYMQMAKTSDQNETEYDQIKNSFGSNTALVVISLAIISTIFSASVISIGFGNYLQSLIGIPSIIGGSLILLTTCYINIIGLRETVNVNSITTILEILGLLIIIVMGYSKWNYKTLTQRPSGGINSILYGSYMFSFAFFGFETLIRLSEETINSKEVIPKAIRDSIIFTMILYILVGMSAISLIGPKRLGSSLAPLSEVVKDINPMMAKIIGVIALGSAYNTVLMTLLTNSRLMYGLIERDIIRIPLIDRIMNLKEKNDKDIPVNVLIFNTILAVLIMVLMPSLEYNTLIANVGIILLLVMINMSYLKNVIQGKQ